MHKAIFIATFSIWQKNKRTPINGMVEPLLQYFLPKTKEIDMLDGLHPGSEDVITKIEQYKNARLKSQTVSWISKFFSPLLHLQNQNATQLTFKIRDFLAVFEWALRSGKTYDIFIGLESIYTIAGIFLKKLGRVKTVVYYVSDYSPKRFSQPFLNNIYLALDRFAVTHADYIWDVSPAILPARIGAGLDEKKIKPVILVPNALFKGQIHPLPEKKLIPYSLVFAGTLTRPNGPDIVVEAMFNILKKFSKTTLHIFGSNGNDQKRIKELIAKLKLEKSVIFHGFVMDAIDLTNDINKYMIGLAPYLFIENSLRLYGDATKLRLYMGAGLPIITTAVPPLGKELEIYGSVIITKDDPKAFADEVIKLFGDKQTYVQMRKKALEYAKKNTWENTYDNALKEMKAQ